MNGLVQRFESACTNEGVIVHTMHTPFHVQKKTRKKMKAGMYMLKTFKKLVDHLGM